MDRWASSLQLIQVSPEPFVVIHLLGDERLLEVVRLELLSIRFLLVRTFCGVRSAWVLLEYGIRRQTRTQEGLTVQTRGSNNNLSHVFCKQKKQDLVETLLIDYWYAITCQENRQMGKVSNTTAFGWLGCFVCKDTMPLPGAHSNRDMRGAIVIW
jgi:hypothetical protein